jgi:hypothetical protein
MKKNGPFCLPDRGQVVFDPRPLANFPCLLEAGNDLVYALRWRSWHEEYISPWQQSAAEKASPGLWRTDWKAVLRRGRKVSIFPVTA